MTTLHSRLRALLDAGFEPDAATTHRRRFVFSRVVIPRTEIARVLDLDESAVRVAS